MSLKAVGVSVVLRGLFVVCSLVPLACTFSDGETTSLIQPVINAAAPAAAAPAMNLRRFRSTLLGVISEEEVSAGFLISIDSGPFKTLLLKRIRDFCRRYEDISKPDGEIRKSL